MRTERAEDRWGGNGGFGVVRSMGLVGVVRICFVPDRATAHADCRSIRTDHGSGGSTAPDEGIDEGTKMTEQRKPVVDAGFKILNLTHKAVLR